MGPFGDQEALDPAEAGRDPWSSPPEVPAHRGSPPEVPAHRGRGRESEIERLDAEIERARAERANLGEEVARSGRGRGVSGGEDSAEARLARLESKLHAAVGAHTKPTRERGETGAEAEAKNKGEGQEAVGEGVDFGKFSFGQKEKKEMEKETSMAVAEGVDLGKFSFPGQNEKKKETSASQKKKEEGKGGGGGSAGAGPAEDAAPEPQRPAVGESGTSSSGEVRLSGEAAISAEEQVQRLDHLTGRLAALRASVSGAKPGPAADVSRLAAEAEWEIEVMEARLSERRSLSPPDMRALIEAGSLIGALDSNQDGLLDATELAVGIAALENSGGSSGAAGRRVHQLEFPDARDTGCKDRVSHCPPHSSPSVSGSNSTRNPTLF